MTVTLTLRDGSTVPIAVSGGGSTAEAATACPACNVSPFRVGGSGSYPAQDDRAYEATAYCLACRERVGVLRAEVSTIFGVREDEAVLHGRARIY